jgi:hypothetical protein
MHEQSFPAVMTRAPARRRKAVAIWAVMALLFSQWTMALHLCLPGDLPIVASAPADSLHADCHGKQSTSPLADQTSLDDLGCALHCAQPDEASAFGKGAMPGAMMDHPGPQPGIALTRERLSLVQPTLDAPPPDARRRLIEHGALLI